MFIGLPTLGVLGCAAFLARQQFLREQDARGPYRAGISQIQWLSVSPFEAWQGFDTKIVVHIKDAGQLNAPPNSQIYSVEQLRQRVRLEGQINGLKASFPVSSQDFGNGYEPEHPGPLRLLIVRYGEGDEPGILAFLAKTSVFDPGTPVQLCGDLWVERPGQNATALSSLPPGWTQEKDREGVRLLARSQTTSLSQVLERTSGINVDHTAPPVEEVHADLLSPVFARTNVVGDNGSGIVGVSFPPGTFSKVLPQLRCTAAQVFDARGRPVILKDEWGRPRYKTMHWDLNSLPATAVVRLPLEDIPLERGALKAKIWFAFDDGWPTCVQTEVRPAWMSNRPRTLQLQKVSVENGNVVVTAQYRGLPALRYEGDLLPGQTKPLLFDARDDTRIIFKLNVRYKRLFTHWSQHYTLPSGKSYWFSSDVSVQSVSCDADGHCRIVYQTNALQALKPGQSARFFAQIGVQGDGMLPIQATISRPKL